MQTNDEVLRKIRTELSNCRGGRAEVARRSGKSEQWISKCLNGTITTKSAFPIMEIALTVIEESRKQAALNNAMQLQIFERANAILSAN